MITLPKVIKHAEHFRCLVKSRSHKDVAHLVDLYDKTCGCEDWQFRSTDRGSREFCIHMIAAKCAFADEMMALIKKKERQHAKAKKASKTRQRSTRRRAS